MDDILVLARRVEPAQGDRGGQPGLGALALEKHPDKTFIGRIAKGFDFLGYHFDRERLTVAAGSELVLTGRAVRRSCLLQPENDAGTNPREPHCRTRPDHC